MGGEGRDFTTTSRLAPGWTSSIIAFTIRGIHDNLSRTDWPLLLIGRREANLNSKSTSYFSSWISKAST